MTWSPGDTLTQIDPRGKKCDACGHSLLGHNSLGYCRQATKYPSICNGSCSWHVSDGHEALARAKRWNEEHGAGKVKRRMEAKGLTVVEERGYFYAKEQKT